MNTVKINNEINLTFPDGFNEMGEEELTRYFSSPNNRWGAYNADEHIILSVGWKKAAEGYWRDCSAAPSFPGASRSGSAGSTADGRTGLGRSMKKSQPW